MQVRQLSADEFCRRLVKLLGTPSPSAFPLNRTDQLVLLSAACIALAARAYSEEELTRAIDDWSAAMGAERMVDRVTLRRYLVDERFLRRDRAGFRYEPAHGRVIGIFEPEVLDLDPLQLVREARLERERRKRAHVTRETK